MKPLYRVGIYCRLSVDDANNHAKSKGYLPANESVSIENQCELLSRITMLNGWVETKTYIDDGYSGGNFRRPGFLEMMEDARKGVINLILVKDLSRLGRDFVEVGRYTDEIFPAMGVRFVSVLDFLDSEGDSTDMLHFRSLMNDYHLRDLSSKIKSVIVSKMKSGQFISYAAPYGYRKSAEDPHKLAIDEYAAGIVQRIFEMRRTGISYLKIATALNQDGVPCPRAYLYQRDNKAACPFSDFWTLSTVKFVLHNEVYIGNLTMNTCGSRSYKDRTIVRKPESEWVRVQGAQEAIISAELWEDVQRVNEGAKRRSAAWQGPRTKLFTGKMICADCGGPMNAITQTRREGYKGEKKYVYYFCGNNFRSGFTTCSPHRISELAIRKIVMAEIREQASAITIDEAAVVDKLLRTQAECDAKHIEYVQKEIKQLRRRLDELENTMSSLYEGKLSGTINQETFMTLIQKNEQERLAKAERLDALLTETNKVKQKTAAIQDWTALIRKYADFQDLDRQAIDELIDHIEINPCVIINGKRHQEIKVFYRFVGSIT